MCLRLLNTGCALSSELDFQHFLYLDSRTQKQSLVLVPKNWLSRASGYQIIAIYNFYTMRGHTYIYLCSVMVFYRVPDFQHILYKD